MAVMPEKLRITTLGAFNVSVGDSDITDGSPRAALMWRLFKYLITCRDVPTSTDALLDMLWSESDDRCGDELKALYSLVYRLRSLLKKRFPDPKPEFILFTRNCYIWNSDSPYELDSEEFERAYTASEAPGLTDAERIALLTRAFELYRGDYLPETQHESWVVPQVTYYRRMYSRVVEKLCAIFKSTGDYNGIVRCCERAVTLAPLEETHHIALIEALIGLDELSQAQTHYDHITGLLYKELGVEPSEKLIELRRRIYRHNADTQYDMTVIRSTLAAPDTGERGAFLCDFDTFRYIYRLELRTMERSGLSAYLACLSLIKHDGSVPPADALTPAMAECKESVATHLRRGDVMTQYSRSQLLLLLSCSSYEAGMAVLRRLEKSYYSDCGKAYKLSRALITVNANG